MSTNVVPLRTGAEAAEAEFAVLAAESAPLETYPEPHLRKRPVREVIEDICAPTDTADP